MATMLPPQKNVEYIFYTGLISQADTKLLQNNPTLAAGDVLVSTDGGATGNLTTLPAVTPAASDIVKVTVSAAEMNGDNIIIVFSDAAGAEWCDGIINIQTSGQSLDAMDTVIDSILTDTAVIGALGAGLTAIPWNANWDAEVQSEVADALIAYDPPTKAEMDTAHALLATVAKQDIIDTVVDGIQTDLNNATDGLGALKTEIDANETKIDTLDTVADGIQTDLDNATDGLGALKALIDIVDTVVDAIKAKTDLRPSGVPKGVEFTIAFKMVLSSDHVTPATGKTLVETISKDGGAFAACTNVFAEIGSGWYKIVLTATEMTATMIALKFTEANCDQRDIGVVTST